MPSRLSPHGLAAGDIVVEISERSLPPHMRLGSFRARLSDRPVPRRGATRGMGRRLAFALLYAPLMMSTLRARSRQRSE